MSKICDRSPPARAARLLAVVAGAVLLLGVAPLANAESYYGTVEIQVDPLASTVDDLTVYVNADRDAETGVDGYEGYELVKTGQAGKYGFLTKPGGINTTPLGSSFHAYCIDMFNDVPKPGWLLDPPQGSSGDQWGTYIAVDLKDLVVGGSGGVPLGETRARYLREYFDLNWLASQTKTQAEAFAAGLWEIMYEDPGDYHLDSGYAKVNVNPEENGLTQNGLLSLSTANGYLSALTGAVTENEVYALTSPDWQDVAFTVPGSGQFWTNTTRLPEPLTMVSLLAGIAGLGGYVVRKRKRA